MKRLIISLFVFGLILYGSAGVIFYFSKDNNITDRAAKLFVNESTQFDLVISKTPCDERRAVVHRIKKCADQHFTHLIIGSSRVMQLGKFTGFKNALNLGVSGCSFEDLQIILELVGQNKITFDSLHLDFNPWYGCPSIDQKFKKFERYHNIQDGLKNIATFGFIRSDLKSILPSMCYSPLLTSPDSCKAHIIFSDGSIKQKSNSEETRIKNLNNSIQNLYHNIRDFYAIDKKYLSQVFQFYHELNHLHPTTIYLSPFHPLLFEKYKLDPRIKNIQETERLFRESCSDIPSLGSFTLDSSNQAIDSKMFLDAMHISEVAIRKYFHPLPSTTPNE